MRNWLCKIGLHDFRFFIWSYYSRREGVGHYIKSKQEIRKCSRCGKYDSSPKWYSEEFRSKYPYSDPVMIFREWEPEVPELLRK